MCEHLEAAGIDYLGEVLFRFTWGDSEKTLRRKFALALVSLEKVAKDKEQRAPGSARDHLVFVDRHRDNYAALMADVRDEILN